MAKQVSFDFFAVMLYTLMKAMDIDMKWAVSVAAAASASVLACAFSQPGDMVSHRHKSLVSSDTVSSQTRLLTVTSERSSQRRIREELPALLERSSTKSGPVVDF